MKLNKMNHKPTMPDEIANPFIKIPACIRYL